jgi:esterase FrsA
MTLSSLSITPGLELYHTGPSLDLGAMPALFYFALSGPDSLGTDPYNQPVKFLEGKPIRVFSLTLPAHEQGLPPQDALKTWAEEMAQGKDPLDQFLDQTALALDFVLRQKLVHEDQIAVAGLSRGGLLASFFAARDPRIRTVLAFAPLTRLRAAKEFHNIASAEMYDIIHQKGALAKKHLRFYIGNRDVRVSTRACFECIEAIAEEAHQHQVRSPQCELIISPSIGHQGHGTSPEIFRQGALWILEQLKVP